jgi:hypothetical protein
MFILKYSCFFFIVYQLHFQLKSNFIICYACLQFRCNSEGLTSPTSFSNCVEGTKVADYGTPYDFNSIMHYSLYA